MEKMIKRRKLSSGQEADSKEVEGASDEDKPVDVKPINEITKRANRGKSERRYYEAVEVDGSRYELEAAVLVAPEQNNEKPYVAIIKEIKQEKNGSVAVTGQWFYRPEEAEKKGGGSWQSTDSRELFYSFHRDEVPAESVMHSCVVHFIPPLKQAPNRSEHPGFIIRQVYDTVEKKLWKLTDKDYEDSKQEEIDLLVQKTKLALGELPNIEPEEITSDTEEVDKNRRSLRRKAVPPLTLNRDDSSEAVGKGDAAVSKGETPLSRGDTPHSARAETPSSCKSPGFALDIMDRIREQNALTGLTARDQWLAKLVTSLKFVFDAEESSEVKTVEVEVRKNVDSDSSVQMEVDSEHKGDGEQDDKKKKVNVILKWPDSAISAVKDLEAVSYDFNSPDMHKYNLKMRQLDYNLKKYPVTARRFLSRDLSASTVFNMTPVELKDGLTTAEKSTDDTPEMKTLQMTGALCSNCGERAVGVQDIIQAGYGSKYKLECQKCGHSWYGSRDSVAPSLTADVKTKLNSTVGLAPWATSKFEEVEKELLSPREAEKNLAALDSFSSRQTKTPDETEGSSQPVSHYDEVEQTLTEHITLSKPPSFSVEGPSNMDAQVTERSEKDFEKDQDKIVDEVVKPVFVDDELPMKGTAETLEVPLV